MFGAIASAVTGLANAGVNAYFSKKNLDFQEDNLDYQKAVQQKIFDREDTSWQRAVQDAQSAGLSPLSVTSGNAAGQAISTQAPQQSMDMTGALSMVSKLADIEQQEKSRESTEQMASDSLAVDKQEADTQSLKAEAEVAKMTQDVNASKELTKATVEKTAKDMLDSDRRYQLDVERVKNDDANYKSTLEEQIRHNKASEKQSESELDERKREYDSDKAHQEFRDVVNDARADKADERAQGEYEMKKDWNDWTKSHRDFDYGFGKGMDITSLILKGLGAAFK